MRYTIRTPYKLISLWLLAALLFQGCAAYPPQQPVSYPPPPAEVEKQPIPQQPIPQQPVPEAEPTRKAPKQTNTIAASFSRQAAEQTRQGRPDLAAATLERGLRAAPKDAMLWSQLAEAQLQQQHYLQARSLAAKSNSLAGSNSAIIKKNHWIIEESLKKAAGQ
jgi:tetratricopeptide (TPR) repeat protein